MPNFHNDAKIKVQTSNNYFMLYIQYGLLKLVRMPLIQGAFKHNTTADTSH